VISAVLVWFLATRSGIDWSAAWKAMRAADRGLLALSVLVVTCTVPLRARRWRTILDPIVPDLPFGPLWRATAIGVMLNNLAPARAGELARAYTLSHDVPAVPFAAAVTSIGIDRIFDAIVVIMLLGLAVADPRFPGTPAVPGSSLAGTMVLGVGGIVFVLMGLYSLVFLRVRILSLCERATRAFVPRLVARLMGTARALADGISVLRSPKRVAAVFGWTLLHWLVQPLAFWIALRAFAIDGPWTMPLFLQGILVIGVALPSSPGFAGLFEAAAVAALGVYGVGRDSAIAWAVAFHVASYVPITAIGMYYFFKLKIVPDPSRRARFASEPGLQPTLASEVR